MRPVLEELQGILVSIVARIPFYVIGAIVFFLFYLAARGSARLADRIFAAYRRPKSLRLVFRRLTRWSIIVLGLLVAFLVAFPGFSVSDLIQLLGISGLAIGIAFRDIFQDFVAGILLLLEEPFRIGDQIAVLDYEGTIENIQTRATAVRTYDGQRVVLPNSDLFTNPVTVKTAYSARRIEYELGIGYGDDPEQARGLILETLKTISHVLRDPPPDVLVTNLAESSVILRVRWWVSPPRILEELESQSDVLEAIRRTLNEHGIDLPFPTRQILFHDQTEETDGDRRVQREGWPAGKDEGPRPHRISDMLFRLSRERTRDGGQE